MLDKSAFQRLSAQESTYLHIHFHENLAPVLAVEIIADLKKVASAKRPMARSAEAEVEQLARKFGGSGPAVNEDYTRLLAAALLGWPVPMTGQVVVGYAAQSADGKGVFIDLHPINHAILRWRQGTFHEWEREAVEWIRQATHDVKFSEFERYLQNHGVETPRARTPEDLRAIADQLLVDPRVQQIWLEWAIALARMDLHEASGARFRWRLEKATSIEQFAPYAGHCIRVLLTIVVAVRSKLLTWDASHARDAEYLLYLPFCQIFVSADKMHVKLAPSLLRSDQIFVQADVLKADLKAIGKFWEPLTDDARRRAHWVLSGYPPPRVNSVTLDLWRRFRGDLRPGANLANRLPEEERAIALEEMRAHCEAAGLSWKLLEPTAAL